MTLAILSFIGLGLIIGGLNAGDKRRYRQGNTHPSVLNCRIVRRGGIWFIKVGRFGGSFYISKRRTDIDV